MNNLRHVMHQLFHCNPPPPQGLNWKGGFVGGLVWDTCHDITPVPCDVCCGFCLDTARADEQTRLNAEGDDRPEDTWIPNWYGQDTLPPWEKGVSHTCIPSFGLGLGAGTGMSFPSIKSLARHH